ncbi:MAG: regulatory protein RecX [Bacteroidales bacterium]|nr:regulatory protein RecX [Bacteroidales bacterium]
MRTDITKEQARSKAEAYCAKSEHCEAEIRMKLLDWKVGTSDAEEVVRHLIDERYIDNHRFAKAFVRDKFRFGSWGKVKIAQHLRAKQIDPSVIEEALDEIDATAYIDTLRRLLAAKSRNVTAHSEYERNGKLIRFALGRGFEMTDILTCIPQSDTME